MKRLFRTLLPSPRITACTVVLLFALTFVADSAARLRSGVCGRVYMTSGEIITACDSMRISVPKKNKKPEIINKAYTKRNEISRRINPSEVDSLVLWAVSSPEHPHTFRFIPGQGWSFVAESTPHIAVYCIAPKGYRLSGNGGLWMVGKSRMFVIKDGIVHEFGKPNQKAGKKFRRRLAALVADDPELAQYIESAVGRRDKILRSLRLYNPQK